MVAFGIVFSFVPATAAFALWVVAAGWLLLVLGNVVKGFLRVTQYPNQSGRLQAGFLFGFVSRP